MLPLTLLFFSIINLCLVMKKSNALKFYVLWTKQWHLILYKISKAYYKTFYTYIRVTEYVRELFFYKLHMQNKGKSTFVHKQDTIFFFQMLTTKKLYFCKFILLWTSINVNHMLYTLDLKLSAQQYWISFETAVHFKEPKLHFSNKWLTGKYVCFIGGNSWDLHTLQFWVLNENESLTLFRMGLFLSHISYND